MIYFLLLLCIFLAAFFNMSEISFLSADRLQVELDKSRGSTISKVQGYIFKKTGSFITTVLVGNNIINVIYGLLAAKLLEEPLSRFIENDFVVVLLQTLISTAVVIVFCEYIPKAIARAMPNRQLRIVAIPLYIAYWVLYPITIIATGLSNLIFKLLGVKNEEGSMVPLGKVDLDYYIENKAKDETRQEETKYLQNALEFAEVKVRDCLIPRNEIEAVDDETPIEELIELFNKTGYSKLLVYNENIDNIIGYIHSIEMYRCQKEGIPWQGQIKTPIYVPESSSAERVMRQMLQRKRNITVVIDELGGTAGIVTLEDIVEEIFGDIEDEHDTKRIVMQQVEEDEYVISGRAEVDTLNEKFDLGIPEDDEYKTIAGFIIYHYQKIPERGDEFALPPNFQVKIVRATGNRITLIRLKKVEP